MLTSWCFVHPYLACWLACWLALCLIMLLHAICFRLPNRIIRHRNIVARGWPPAHLDADGDLLSNDARRKDVQDV